ncbi:MAG: DNA mismatch repair protein MutS [Crocinitomicaceae bacterium]|nr:DNA mismatch repair protein MutS [Crocinitomicaceae bacterium]MDG1734428.1 DNA mismatch repair protein MutS [Crocinitomicaceae bacterium]MDG2506565.1 DNA mismatch repair protein MutS [Crocinitomicaceae bacterium]
MKPTTDAQTLIDLEFDKILEWCAGFALSDRTKQKILNTSPLSDFDQLQESLSQLQDLKRIKDAERGFPSLEFEELDQELRLLKIKNAVVPLSGILKIHQASFLVNSIIEFFEEHAEQTYVDLEKVLANTYKTMDIIVPIEKVIDPAGQIKDSASTELKSIRDSIRSTQRQIKRNFDKELRKLSKTNLLSDTKETVINNRRVFSIKSSYKKQFPGLVLGSSKTGNVAHIEPEVNMALNVELDHLFIDEEKEIYKILRDLTKEMAAHDWLIRAYNKVLHDLDLIHAKHRLSIAMKAVKPNLIKERVIDVKGALHPLLNAKNNKENKPTYGQDVCLNQQQRILVISGPNAGGKSITLKTLGLFQVMVQSGLFIPAKEDNRFGLFRQIYSEIGDNQSIENELSTYSYRLKRMKKFLALADPDTLLLLDEFGTGSDPELGGALAESFFESLYRKKIFGILTTHYSNIKSRAVQLPEAVNGCMLFNAKNLSPKFEFKIGQPGSSFTFEVAEINGVPKELLNKAKKKLDQEKLKLNDLLSDLQKKTNKLDQEIRINHEQSTSYSEKSTHIDQSKEKLRLKFEKVNQTIQTQEKQLAAGKKMLEFIEAYKNTKGKKTNDELTLQVMQFLKAQKTKNDVKKKTSKPSRQLSKKQIANYQQERIAIGSKVKIIATRQIAIVEAMKGKNTTLSIGNTRIKVALDKLIWVS